MRESCLFPIMSSVHFDTLATIAQENDSHLTLLSPYKEHLAQAFARFFMRVGLPADIPKFSKRVKYQLPLSLTSQFSIPLLLWEYYQEILDGYQILSTQYCKENLPFLYFREQLLKSDELGLQKAFCALHMFLERGLIIIVGFFKRLV